MLPSSIVTSSSPRRWAKEPDSIISTWAGIIMWQSEPEI
jgi:hypothetical protein